MIQRRRHRIWWPDDFRLYRIWLFNAQSFPPNTTSLSICLALYGTPLLGVLWAFVFFVLQMRESLFFWQEFSDQREANRSCSRGSSLWLRPLAAWCLRVQNPATTEKPPRHSGTIVMTSANSFGSYRLTMVSCSGGCRPFSSPFLGVHRVYRLAFTLSVFLLSPFTAVGADPTAEAFFREKVEPILATHCLQCHASDRKGGLDLTHKDAVMKGGDSGTVLTPGNPDESLLLDYVSSEVMPPDEPLSSAEIETLRQWIQQDAYYPDTPLDPFAISTASRAGYDWWSLKPLSSSEPPHAAKLPSSWSDSPIDRFVFAKLAELGLQPSPPADKRSLIRRVTFDLTGLPPSYEDVEAFVNDNDPRAYERLIDRLLASPHYGEHWGRHWLDVVRFGESRGFERNEIINNAWPFRDYVIRSLNEDKPFDRLIIEHLAGDMVANNDPGIEVGTTFLVAGPYDDVGNQDAAQAAQIRANTLDDMIRTTGEAFLGLTVGCGRCHNHKFDPVTQADYYSMYATFAGVQHGNRVVASKQQRQEHAERVAPLDKKKAELDKEKADLQKKIQTQADSNAEQLEKQWVRPAIHRQATEDKFPETRAKFVRLIATALDTNPQAATGYNIDEFEVWTADEPSRNVALATAGAQAEARVVSPRISLAPTARN